MISSIDLVFTSEQSPLLVLTALQKAGWYFGHNTIDYDIRATDSGDIVDTNTMPLSELNTVIKIFDEALEQGKSATVALWWLETTQGYCTFYSKINCYFTFFARRPQIEECGRFTDFNWLIQRIVCPLYNAGCNVLTMICKDDFD